MKTKIEHIGFRDHARESGRRPVFAYSDYNGIGQWGVFAANVFCGYHTKEKADLMVDALNEGADIYAHRIADNFT
jgi:hypothetical protein